MADESTTDHSNSEAAETTTTTDESKNTETVEGVDKTVPYDVFQKKNAALREAEDKLKALEAEKAAAAEAAAKEQGKFEDLYNQTKPQAERAAALEKALETTLESMLSGIPEEKHTLIPDLPVEQKLEYISKNRALLMAEEKPKNVGTSSSQSTDGEQVTDTTIFTTEQIKDPKFYRENREAILKAQKEGRIK